MKTVMMTKDYAYRVSRRVFVQYRAGVEYQRVPEVQVRAILAADAGEIVDRRSAK